MPTCATHDLVKANVHQQQGFTGECACLQDLRKQSVHVDDLVSSPRQLIHLVRVWLAPARLRKHAHCLMTCLFAQAEMDQIYRQQKISCLEQ